MAGYDRYKDSNGVTWTVITANNGFTMVGSVLDDADPRYDPPAEDQQAKMAEGGIQVGSSADIVHTDPPTGEQTRTLFIELVGDIEKYAAAHKGAVLLKVTASPGIPWWVWAGLGFVVLGGGRRRR